MIERFKPLEAIRTTAYVVRLMGAEALAAIDRRLDWVPDDTKEEATIKSRIWAEVVEAPVATEAELDAN